MKEIEGNYDYMYTLLQLLKKYLFNIFIFSLIVQANVIILYGTINSSDDEYLKDKLKWYCQTASCEVEYKYLRGVSTKSPEIISENALKPHSNMCIIVTYKNDKDRNEGENIIKKMLPRMAKTVIDI